MDTSEVEPKCEPVDEFKPQVPATPSQFGADPQVPATPSQFGADPQVPATPSQFGSSSVPPSESGVTSERRSYSSGIGSSARASSGPTTSSVPTSSASTRNPRASVSIPMRLVSECTNKIVCIATTDESVYKGMLVTYDEVILNLLLSFIIFFSFT